MEAPLSFRLGARAVHGDDPFAVALAALRAGAVVALPTDTFYGLAVDPRDGAAIKRLLELKGHPPGRAVLLLAASLEQVHAVAEFDGVAGVEPLGRLWPAPLTLILPLRMGLTLTGCPEGSVAVRIPDAHPPRRLATDLGFPITGTSANPAAAAPAVTATEVRSYFGAGVAVLLDGGPTPGGSASTLVDLSGAEPVLRRSGGVAREVIERALGRPLADLS